MSFNARAAPGPGKEQRSRAAEEGAEGDSSASHVGAALLRGGRRHKHIRFAPLCAVAVAVAVDVEAARQASGSGSGMNDLCVLD